MYESSVCVTFKANQLIFISARGLLPALFEGLSMTDRVISERVHTKPLVLLPQKYEDMSLIAIVVDKEGKIQMFSNGTGSKEKAYEALSRCLTEVETKKETEDNAVHEVRPGKAWLPPTAVGCD